MFEQIDQVFNQQERDWNNGDIPTFMEGYMKNDSISFMGSNGVSYGWSKIKANYLKGYPTKDIMGELKFTILDKRKLSNHSAFYLGKFELERDSYAYGYFTVIWKKEKGEWLIIHDHTSAGK